MAAAQKTATKAPAAGTPASAALAVSPLEVSIDAAMSRVERLTLLGNAGMTVIASAYTSAAFFLAPYNSFTIVPIRLVDDPLMESAMTVSVDTTSSTAMKRSECPSFLLQAFFQENNGIPLYMYRESLAKAGTAATGTAVAAAAAAAPPQEGVTAGAATPMAPIMEYTKLQVIALSPQRQVKKSKQLSTVEAVTIFEVPKMPAIVKGTSLVALGGHVHVVRNTSYVPRPAASGPEDAAAGDVNGMAATTSPWLTHSSFVVALFRNGMGVTWYGSEADKRFELHNVFRWTEEGSVVEHVTVSVTNEGSVLICGSVAPPLPKPSATPKYAPFWKAFQLTTSSAFTAIAGADDGTFDELQRFSSSNIAELPPVKWLSGKVPSHVVVSPDGSLVGTSSEAPKVVHTTAASTFSTLKPSAAGSGSIALPEIGQQRRMTDLTFGLVSPSKPCMVAYSLPVESSLPAAASLACTTTAGSGTVSKTYVVTVERNAAPFPEGKTPKTDGKIALEFFADATIKDTTSSNCSKSGYAVLVSPFANLYNYNVKEPEVVQRNMLFQLQDMAKVQGVSFVHQSEAAVLGKDDVNAKVHEELRKAVDTLPMTTLLVASLNRILLLHPETLQPLRWWVLFYQT